MQHKQIKLLSNTMHRYCIKKGNQILTPSYFHHTGCFSTVPAIPALPALSPSFPILNFVTDRNSVSFLYFAGNAGNEGNAATVLKCKVLGEFWNATIMKNNIVLWKTYCHPITTILSTYHDNGPPYYQPNNTVFMYVVTTWWKLEHIATTYR